MFAIRPGHRAGDPVVEGRGDEPVAENRAVTDVAGVAGDSVRDRVHGRVDSGAGRAVARQAADRVGVDGRVGTVDRQAFVGSCELHRARGLVGRRRGVLEHEAGGGDRPDVAARLCERFPRCRRVDRATRALGGEHRGVVTGDVARVHRVRPVSKAGRIADREIVVTGSEGVGVGRFAVLRGGYTVAVPVERRVLGGEVHRGMGDERGVLVCQQGAARVGRAVGIGRVAAVRPVCAVSSRPGVGRAPQKVVEGWHLLEVRGDVRVSVVVVVTVVCNRVVVVPPEVEVIEADVEHVLDTVGQLAARTGAHELRRAHCDSEVGREPPVPAGQRRVVAGERGRLR